jgi:hypothetical protein
LQATWVRASGVQERALQAQETARRAREKARAARETARWLRSPEAALPPLEYVLLPLPLVRSPRAAAPGDRLHPSPGATTTLYLWGYAPPESDVLREWGEPTAAARRFAAESGWEETRPGAWAKEITLPMALSQAMQAMEAVLRREAALAGWGMRYES